MRSTRPRPGADAITATGASTLQVLRYGVVPQVIPPFLSFTIYRWDINVRMSTIIGFVGGGGIGYILKPRVDLGEWGEWGECEDERECEPGAREECELGGCVWSECLEGAECDPEPQCDQGTRQSSDACTWGVCAECPIGHTAVQNNQEYICLKNPVPV